MYKTALLLSPFEWELMNTLQGSEVVHVREVLDLMVKLKEWEQLLCLKSHPIEQVQEALNSIGLKLGFHYEFLVKLTLKEFREYRLLNVRDHNVYPISFSSSGVPTFKGRVVNFDRKLGIYDFAWTPGLVIKDVSITDFSIYSLETFGVDGLDKELNLYFQGYLPKDGWVGLQERYDAKVERKSKIGSKSGTLESLMEDSEVGVMDIEVTPEMDRSVEKEQDEVVF